MFNVVFVLVIICLCGHLEGASGTGFLTGAHIYVSMMHVELRLRLLSTSFAFCTVHRSFVALKGVMYLARRIGDVTRLTVVNYS